MNITIYNLVTDTDNGTETFSYPRRSEAEAAYVAVINANLEDYDIPPADTFEEAREGYDQICEKGFIDSFGVHEQTLNFGPEPPAPGLKQFYVTKGWDNFPEGGTCGEIIWAKDYADAEEQMTEIMIGYRLDDDPGDPHHEDYIRSLTGEWHTVDCYPLEGLFEFLKTKKNQW